jgi:hypothetical protein
VTVVQRTHQSSGTAKKASIRRKAAASGDPLYLGVIYRREPARLEDHIRAGQTGGEDNAPKVLQELFQRYA